MLWAWSRKWSLLKILLQGGCIFTSCLQLQVLRLGSMEQFFFKQCLCPQVGGWSLLVRAPGLPLVRSILNGNTLCCTATSHHADSAVYAQNQRRCLPRAAAQPTNPQKLKWLVILIWGAKYYRVPCKTWSQDARKIYDLWSSSIQPWGTPLINSLPVSLWTVDYYFLNSMAQTLFHPPCPLTQSLLDYKDATDT